MLMFSIVMRTPVGATPLKFSLIDGTATDDAADHFVALGYHLLDAEVDVGARGLRIGYLLLVGLYIAFFTCTHAVVYEVGSQEFYSCVQIPSVVDIFGKAPHQGLVFLFL